MFGKRIVELRKREGLTQAELARVIGISRSSLSLYEIEKREPDIKTLSKLASLFNVPVGYILGNERETIDHKNNSTSTFCYEIASRIKKIAVASNKNLNELLPLLKTKILDGKCYNIDDFMQDIYTISDFLGVTDEYILGGKELENRTDYSLNDEEKKFLFTFQQLDQDNKDIILGDMKKYIKQQKQESVAADEDLKRTGTTNSVK